MGILDKLFGRKQDKQATMKPTPATPASKPEPAPAQETIKVTEITPAALMARINNGDDVFIVDMRQPWEYQAGHIPGAVNVFIQEIPSRLSEFPKDKDIVFQCWHGNTSLDACAFLMQQGWSGQRLTSLSGGMVGWVQTHGQAGMVQD